MDPAPAIEALQSAVTALRSLDTRTQMRAIQQAQDALDAAKAEALAELAETREFEADGASTINTWVRNELRLSAREAATLTRVAPTLTMLPAVGEAASQGRIRAEHVAVFTYGIKHVGLSQMVAAESWLLDVALTCDPNELFTVVRRLREAVYPEELDQAWIKGMDKHDLQVNPVPDGYHVKGFLNTVTGAKFKTVLDSVAAPRDVDDHRAGAERRVDGLDRLLTSILESGLPSDGGIRPHLSVLVDANTLDTALRGPSEGPASPTAGTPAVLTGFGSIGPRLLGYLACGADLTGILTRGNTKILDVGRTQRLATMKQRRAIIARQHGVCAAPGCANTHLEIHHTTWWTHGGPTNLDNLTGLCVRCHHLVHRGLLNITNNNGETDFTNSRRQPLRHRRRDTTRDIHDVATHIRTRRRDHTINRT